MLDRSYILVSEYCHQENHIFATNVALKYDRTLDHIEIQSIRTSI